MVQTLNAATTWNDYPWNFKHGKYLHQFNNIRKCYELILKKNGSGIYKLLTFVVFKSSYIVATYVMLDCPKANQINIFKVKTWDIFQKDWKGHKGEPGEDRILCVNYVFWKKLKLKSIFIFLWSRRIYTIN